MLGVSDAVSETDPLSLAVEVVLMVGVTDAVSEMDDVTLRVGLTEALSLVDDVTLRVGLPLGVSVGTADWLAVDVVLDWRMTGADSIDDARVLMASLT